MDLPYPELADRFLDRHGLAGMTKQQVDLDALLERDFFRASLGLFDVWIPTASLGEKETAQDYRDVCAALCEAQRHWIGWLGTEANDADEITKDLLAVRKWVKKWKPGVLTKAAGGTDRDALALFAASEQVRETSVRLATAMRKRTARGETGTGEGPIPLVLVPERTHFVEFIAFAGWYLPEQRGYYWVPGIETWSELRFRDLQVIALQYPAANPLEGDYAGASSMKDRAVTGLEQQVVQLGMNQLLARVHAAVLPAPVIRGLSILMLIEIYGTCDTRNDGDLRGLETSMRSVFIRGGKSEGGRLPKNGCRSVLT